MLGNHARKDSPTTKMASNPASCQKPCPSLGAILEPGKVQVLDLSQESQPVYVKKTLEDECQLEPKGNSGLIIFPSPRGIWGPLTLTKMTARRRQRTVEYGGASGPAALSEDGGSGEAAASRSPSGQLHRQRPAVDVPGSSNGRERRGLPAAGRRDKNAARSPAEGTRGTARGADILPGSLLREHGPEYSCKRRRRGAPGPAPAAAAAPGPRAVAPSLGSPLPEVRDWAGPGRVGAPTGLQFPGSSAHNPRPGPALEGVACWEL